MWGGKIRFTTPMLFSIGFLFQFLIAGLTGIMLSVAPFDWQLQQFLFRRRALPLVLVGAILFCIFAAFTTGIPK